MIPKSLDNILTEKGIFIDKKIPREEFLQKEQRIFNLFEDAGYTYLNHQLVLFLCYFDTMKIPHKGYMVEFNLSDMTRYFPKHEMIYLQDLTQLELYPVGTMQSGWYNLFADENAAVYAIHIEADELIYYGENPFVALENILKNNPLETKRL